MGWLLCFLSSLPPVVLLLLLTPPPHHPPPPSLSISMPGAARALDVAKNINETLLSRVSVLPSCYLPSVCSCLSCFCRGLEGAVYLSVS